ncbi:MAG: hypothetical protein A2W99_01220 [Bacteroidetes bacterium GWF2_33_16]|nr:MAG: hypothetical protein A2X00_03925 [Bacteroidetes bacterium GWE2_32_14]OFY08879.1 MAG: hypothetical protein A2W99_01220 [Bacteroidetes bacterium GWF2_33_16]
MNKICKIFIAIIVFASISGATKAQENKTDKEQQIKSQKIAFFTEKIGLTPAEAEKFWPVYNDYWAIKNNIIAERKEKMSYFAENSNKMSQAELTEYADKYIKYEGQLAELLNEYHIKFKMILPIEKVMRIYQADYEFKTYLLKKIKDSGKENE